MNKIYIPVSIGEILDKISILEIKLDNLKDKNKKSNVKNELNLLKKIVDSIDISNCSELLIELKEINKQLWFIEENKRIKEKEKNFDKEFIELSRSVYIFNDKRAFLKKKINILTNSFIIEEKSYD